MLAAKLLSGMAGGAEEKLFVDDVFAAHTYLGNGSTQTINNGIDLAGKGGLVWVKRRDQAEEHLLFDTARGINKYLASNSTQADTTAAATLTAFNSNGFSAGATIGINASPYVSWTFRKAQKFFDVVTYTGDGTNGRKINHSLGAKPGMIIIKNTGNTSDWVVYHRGASGDLFLNGTYAQNGSMYYFRDGADPHPHTATQFNINYESSIAGNASGASYVAYLFAHDPSADGIIQCGGFTTEGSGDATVNLGWEPQFVLLKSTSESQNWRIYDVLRGADYTNSNELRPNTSDSEQSFAGFKVVVPTANGFTTAAIGSNTFIYLAIRRPNKPPTSGTQVYNAIARTGTGAAATVTGVGFAPDTVTSFTRNQNFSKTWWDRLRGTNRYLTSNGSNNEVVPSNADNLTSFTNDGINLGADNSTAYINYSNFTYINHFFRRAPGFFDVVCYTGTGAARTVNHSLGVAPELMIVKSRNNATNWLAFHTLLAGSFSRQALNFDSGAASFNFAVGAGLQSAWSASVLNLDGNASVNGSAATYVAYLFASLPGISKCGAYTGNGTSQTIPCGFTTGARLLLIKRTDSTGDWYVWDSTRGIVAANDPHLSLNTTATEVTTDDSVDQESSGFIVNQNTATNINVSGGSYIFLSVA